MRQYLQCIVTRLDDTMFVNELKLSEVHLITTLLKENKSVLVEMKTVPKSVYESIF